MQYEIIEDNLNTLKFAKDVAEYILKQQKKVTESILYILVEKGTFSLPEFKRYKYNPTKKLMTAEPKWEHEEAYGRKDWQLFQYLGKVFQGSALFQIPANLPFQSSKFTLAVWNINYDGVAEVSQKLSREIASLRTKRHSKLPIDSAAKIYKINYVGRQIILNGIYLVSEQQFDRYTEHWFQYIFEHPNKVISVQELRQKTKALSQAKEDNFHKFLGNIGFKGELRNLFFDVSETKIKLNNPITGKLLLTRKVNTTELGKELLQLEKIK